MCTGGRWVCSVPFTSPACGRGLRAKRRGGRPSGGPGKGCEGVDPLSV
jgi:hypothetical protein